MVERIALLKCSTGALITIVSIFIPIFILLFALSECCSFALWTWFIIPSAVLLIPIAILGTIRDGESLTSASDMKLWRLLNKQAPIQITTNDESFTIEKYAVTSDTLIKWYPKGYWNSEVRYYSIVEGIYKGHTILIGGVKPIII